MVEKIAVETLTLNEISDLFRESLEIAHPRARGAIAIKMKKLERAKISNHKWVLTYEIFKGAKLNFYCEKIPKKSQPIISIGMTHRTSKGMILITIDVSNGGIVNGITRSAQWEKWVRIYTGHFCERFAQRIMKADLPIFKIGSEGIMFSDFLGPVRITDTLSEGIVEIEFQFKEGQAYGYRDSKSKIVYFKTVYSNDMLKGGRSKFREDWKEPLNQLYELFKWNS
jgi:hypothetical protein